MVTLTTRTSLILWPLLNLNRGGGHSLYIHGHCGHSNSVWSLSLLGRSYSGHCSTSIEGVVTHCLFMVTVVTLIIRSLTVITLTLVKLSRRGLSLSLYIDGHFINYVFVDYHYIDSHYSHCNDATYRYH